MILPRKTNAFADVLMVETVCGALPNIFPMGVVDLMNRLGDIPKLGKNEHDVTTDDIRRARVVALPIHWFYSMEPALAWARHYKRVNPGVKIVSGGYSATTFDETLMRSGVLDYIIRGDAEALFPALVRRILDGQPTDDIPNLTTRDGRSATAYGVSPADYGAGNYRDISWFPTYERLVLKLQHVPEVNYLYPWVPVMKGCLFNCDRCFAATSIQATLFGRPSVIRPPHAVRQDLHYFSERPDIRHVHFSADFITVCGIGHARQILDGSQYDLDCYYEWYRPPTAEGMALLAGTFKKLTVGLFFNGFEECVNTGENKLRAQEEKLAHVLGSPAIRRGARVILYVDPELAKRVPGYAAASRRLAGFHNVRINRYDGEVIPSMRRLDAPGFASLYDGLNGQALSELPTLRQRHRLYNQFVRHAPSLIPGLFRVNSFNFGRELERFALAGGAA